MEKLTFIFIYILGLGVLYISLSKIIMYGNYWYIITAIIGLILGVYGKIKTIEQLLTKIVNKKLLKCFGN